MWISTKATGKCQRYFRRRTKTIHYFFGYKCLAFRKLAVVT